MAKKHDFSNSLEERLWDLFVLSDGNLEFASEFVRERNRIRQEEKSLDRQR